MALNWPTFHHDTAASLFRQPSPPELPSDLFAFHDNPFNHSSFINNGAPNLQFHDSIKYPTLSSSYNPPQQVFTTPLTDLHQFSGYTHGYSSSPLFPNVYDQEEIFPVNPTSQLLPLPEIYHGGCCAAPFPPWYDDAQLFPVAELPQEPPVMPEMYYAVGGCSSQLPPLYGCGVMSNLDENVQVTKKINGDGGVTLSAQSMAARVRRRKISEKTQELGKLVPGGHRMNTAAMFEAASKYIKFLKAQVGVLKLMENSSQGNEEAINNGELQALITSPSVQEKLYAAEKCIVAQTLAETVAIDDQEMKNK